jgi:hypothetical protein
MPTAPRPRFGGSDPSLGAGIDSPASLDRPFTVPLLVRGSGHRLGIGFLLMAGLLLLCALAAQVKRPGDPLVPVCLFFAVVCGFVGLVNLGWNLPRRRWLEVSRGGFVVSSRKRTTSYQDHDVVGISFRYAAGGVGRHHVTIVTDGEDDAPIRCTYVIPLGMPDPLAAFWHRLQQAMIRRVTAGLGEGVSLTGAGWRFDASGLTYRRRGRAGVVPVENIQKAGFFDGHLCLWADDQELPFLRVPTASRNALLLASLVQGRIGDSSKTPPLPGKPLGRIVLRRRSADVLVGLGGFALVCGCILFAFLSRTDAAGLRPGSLPILLACAALFASPFLVFFLRGLRYRSLVFHESGVSQSAWGGRRALLFTDIETFVCDGNLRLDFLPAIGSPLRPIRFRHCYRKFDLDLASLVEHLSGVVMARIGRNFTTEPVPWTSRLRFLPNGLEYRPRGVFGSPPPVTVPYHLTSYRVVGKHFYLHVAGQPRPVVREALAGPNFYPGLHLLRSVYARLHQGTTAGPPDAGPAPAAPPGRGDERFTTGDPGMRKPHEG